MSYILDALRKADAERERGTVPGIHAQPTFAGGPQSPSPRGAQPWIFVLGGAAALLLVIVAVLVWRGNGSDAKPTVAALPAPSTAPLPTAPVAPAPSPASTPVAVATAPTTPAPAVPQRPVASARTEPAPVARKPKPMPAASAVPAQATGPVPANVPAPASLPPASTEPAESKIYTVNELPDDIRRQLPALTIGGSVYSPVAANRILFINGQVIHEGDVVAPGVVLQQIRMKLAVLTIKGYRYSVPF